MMRIKILLLSLALYDVTVDVSAFRVSTTPKLTDSTILRFKRLPLDMVDLKIGLMSRTLPSTSSAGASLIMYSSTTDTQQEQHRYHQQEQNYQQQQVSPINGSSSGHSKATLALLTFDLDDTLYPLDKVIDAANTAFARAMESYGFSGIRPDDIQRRSVLIRSQMDPEQAMVLTHTQLRQLAIRAEMEHVMLQRKLEETAKDWATNVESLGKIVVDNAKKWSTKAVSSSIVDAVLTAWEMERHHAAERHLYPEVIPALKAIKSQYPDVVIGAVTDGKANPMFMTFTLGKYFDFCINWEDDQGGRRKFFQELSKVEGNAELSWIYNAAFEKGKTMSEAAAAIKEAATASSNSGNTKRVPRVGEEGAVWIHVGDDLAYDVGGSAQCGAKTVLAELADKYGQTARFRFDPNSYKNQPSWSTSSQDELNKRAIMNEAAKEFVDAKLEYWHLLPEIIDNIIAQQ